MIHVIPQITRFLNCFVANQHSDIPSLQASRAVPYIGGTSEEIETPKASPSQAICQSKISGRVAKERIPTQCTQLQIITVVAMASAHTKFET